mgnify:FL=1
MPPRAQSIEEGDIIPVFVESEGFSFLNAEQSVPPVGDLSLCIPSWRSLRTILSLWSAASLLEQKKVVVEQEQVAEQH